MHQDKEEGEGTSNLQCKGQQEALPGSPAPTPASSTLLSISRNFRGVASLDQPEKAEDKKAGKKWGGKREGRKGKGGQNEEEKKREKERDLRAGKREEWRERDRRGREASEGRSP